MSRHLNQFADDRRERLKKVRPSEARRFLFRHGYNSSSFILPEFYKPSGFDKITLDAINWNSGKVQPSDPIDLVAPKGEVGWRRFSIIHPYAYWHIVDSVTQRHCWTDIRRKLVTSTAVASYTIPYIGMRDKTIQGSNISAWLRFAETDLVADAAMFTHLGVTDIQNFYPSVYTHSLAWAIDGRLVIKAKMHDFKYTGNRVDKLFQSAHGNQTNGIPIGSQVSDIISEVLLVDVDEKLSALIPDGVVVARYRDDYRILANSYHEAKEVLSAIGRLLHDEFGLTLSAQKSSIESDVLTAAIRPWKKVAVNSIALRRLTDSSGKVTGKHFKEALVTIYDLQKRFPTNNVCAGELPQISKNLEKGAITVQLGVDDLRSVIAMLRMLMHLREEASPHIVLLADRLLEGVADSIAKPLIADMIAEERTSQNDFREIWMYRLAMHRYPDLALDILKDTNSPLLRMVRMARPHIEEFPRMANLSPHDAKELEQFSFVDGLKLKNTENKPLRSSDISPWRQRYP